MKNIVLITLFLIFYSMYSLYLCECFTYLHNNLYKYKLFVYMCVCSCCRGQKGMSDPIGWKEPDLSSLVWVLGTKLGLQEEQYIYPSLISILNFVFIHSRLKLGDCPFRCYMCSHKNMLTLGLVNLGMWFFFFNLEVLYNKVWITKKDVLTARCREVCLSQYPGCLGRRVIICRKPRMIWQQASRNKQQKETFWLADHVEKRKTKI